MPNEPTVEELIAQATRELEMQNQDLAMKLLNKDNECKLLKEHINSQKGYYKNIISNMAIAFFEGEEDGN